MTFDELLVLQQVWNDQLNEYLNRKLTERLEMVRDMQTEEQTEAPYEMLVEYEVQYQAVDQDPVDDDWTVSTICKNQADALKFYALEKKQYGEEYRVRLVQLITRTHVVQSHEPVVRTQVDRTVPYKADVRVASTRLDADQVRNPVCTHGPVCMWCKRFVRFD